LNDIKQKKSILGKRNSMTEGRRSKKEISRGKSLTGYNIFMKNFWENQKKEGNSAFSMDEVGSAWKNLPQE